MKNSDQAKIENSEQLMGALIETTSKFQNSIRHELNTSLGTFIAELDVLKYEDTGINQNMIDGLTTSLDQYLNTLIAYDALFREYKDNPDSIPEKVGTDYLINILPKHTRYLKLVADGEKEQQQWIINIAKDATRIPFPSHSLNFFKDLRGGRYAFPLDESNFRSDSLRNYGLLAEELEYKVVATLRSLPRDIKETKDIMGKITGIYKFLNSLTDRYDYKLKDNGLLEFPRSQS